MSTNQRVVSPPNDMQLTESEIEVLNQHFSASLANVVSARIEAESVVTETNVQPVIANRPRPGKKGGKKRPGKKGGKKRPAKKGTKKGAAKKGTKKSAAKKGTKKGARKTSKKK